jgi:transposase InsO family protein
VKYAVIHTNVGTFKVQMMCGMLDVSRAGYYAWRDRKESLHAVKDRELAAKVREIHDRSRRTYGSPRVFAELKMLGERCGRKRVARLMRTDGLVGIKRLRYKASPSDGGQREQASPNLVARKFDPKAYLLNQVWAGDFTEVPTGDGTLYLAIVLELRSREVIGWSMRTTRDAAMLIEALQMALSDRRPSPGLIFHSDQGSQYSSKPFRDVLGERGIIQSMSRKGNCWDNAPVESFFATMKGEIEALRKPRTRAAAQAAIFEYLAVFYNLKRLHSSIGNQVPASVGREAA